MEKIDKIMEQRIGDYKRQRDWRLLFYILVIVLLGLLVYVEFKRYQVEVRSHNLDTFYRSLTCDDLPLDSETSVAACEEAIGGFMLRERGLLTTNNEKK